MKVYLVYNNNSNMLRDVFSSEEKAKDFIEYELEGIKNAMSNDNSKNKHIFDKILGSPQRMGSYIIQFAYLKETIFDENDNFIESKTYSYRLRDWEVK